MIGLTIFLLSLAGYALFFLNKFDLQMEETPIFSVAVIIIGLYLFGIFGALPVGVIVVLASGFLLLAVTIYQRRKSLLELIKSAARPGFIVYLLGIPVLYLLARNIIFYYWDEFSHWGLVVKSMNLTGALPDKNSMLMFVSYPPGTALFQHFACRVIGAREGIIVFAHVLMVWSGAVALTKGIKWKQFPLVLLAFAAAFTAYIHFSNSMWCIYVDGLLGMLMASIFALYYRSGERRATDVLKTLPLLALLTLVKESGIFLSVLLCMLMAVDQWLLHRQTREIRAKNGSLFKKYPAVPALAFAILTPVVFNLSWMIHLRAVGVQGGQSLAQNVFMNQGNTAANAGILPAFLNATVNMPIGLTSPGMQAFSNAAFMLGLALAFTAVFVLAMKEKELRRRAIIIVGMFTVVLVIYSAGLVLTYTYKFNQYEGTRLASYGRYMSTIFLPLYLSILILILDRVKDPGVTIWRRMISAVLCLGMVITFFFITPYGFTYIFNRKTHDSTRTAISTGVKVLDGVARSTDRIFIIWQNTSGLKFLQTKYELYPMQVNSNWSIGEPYGSNDIWTRRMTAAEWEKMLFGYQYVYIGGADAEFIQQFGSLFQSGDVQNNRIYKVTVNGGAVTLSPLQAEQ